MHIRRYTILFFLFFQFAVKGWSQFIERFLDNELHNSPTWRGNTDQFRVASNMLQSNFSTKGVGYIATELSFSDSIAWSFDCGMAFGATTTTFVQVFLISDTENPSQCSNGYFLSLKAGVISLCKINNKTVSTLMTVPEISIASLAMYQFEIVRRKSNWSIELRNGAIQTFKTTFSEQQPLTPKGYFCFYCSLNSSASLTGFYSEYIEVLSLKGTGGSVIVPDPDPDPEEPIEPNEPLDPDDISTPIAIRTVVPIDSVTIRVVLNRSADLSRLRAELLDHDEQPRCVATASGNEVIITTSDPFISGKDYTLFLAGIIDQTTELHVQLTRRFTYFPSILARASLRISELMLNPNGVKGIPNAEYVEIYNSSTESIDLSGYGLLYGDNRYIMPSYVLPSGRYAVLTHHKYADLFESNLLVVPLNSFPALNNTSKSIGLSNPVRQTIAQFVYSNQWYGSEIRSKGGYSLECIDLSNPLNDASNWSASLAPEGGTPGKRNSIERSNLDQSEASIIEISHPHDDQLRIRFSKEMNISDLLNPQFYRFSTNGLRVTSSFATIVEPYYVTLYLNRLLTESDRTLLSVEGIRCLSQRLMVPLTDYPIALPQPPELGDVCINEILTNPHEGGVDYIEIYNRSSRTIDLSELLLSSRNSLNEVTSRKIITSDRVGLPPHHYQLFTTDTVSVRKQYGDRGASRFRKIATMPTLNNKEGCLILFDRSLHILDEFYYNESLHTTAMKEKKAISLERLSFDLPTDDPNNWGSASSAFRYGTPGYENSQIYEFNTSNRKFSISPKMIVLNRGNKNDRLFIQYDLPGDEHWVDIEIINLNSYVVKTICRRTLLAGKGVFVWDGKNERGVRLPTGIYVVYIKSISNKRVTKIYRYDFVVW